jgi:hypothetical protein
MGQANEHWRPENPNLSIPIQESEFLALSLRVVLFDEGLPEKLSDLNAVSRTNTAEKNDPVLRLTSPRPCPLSAASDCVGT